MVFLRHIRIAQFLRHYSTKEVDEATKVGKEKCSEYFSRKGDNGTSKTLLGEVLQKNDKVFNAIGATEELLSHLGLAKEYAYEYEHDYTDKLKRIQTTIIDISSAISRASDKNLKSFPSTYTKELEDWIFEYSKELTPPEQYIIPGGGVPSASLHVARSVCRRTEREIIPFVQNGSVDKETLIYLNRLSDFLFTISRIAAKKEKRTESIYIPRPEEIVQPQ